MHATNCMFLLQPSALGRKSISTFANIINNIGRVMGLCTVINLYTFTIISNESSNI